MRSAQRGQRKRVSNAVQADEEVRPHIAAAIDAAAPRAPDGGAPEPEPELNQLGGAAFDDDGFDEGLYDGGHGAPTADEQRLAALDDGAFDLF